MLSSTCAAGCEGAIVPLSTRTGKITKLLLSLAVLPMAHSVCAQTLVVIVNPSVGVLHLSRREVLDIFLGRHRAFPSGAYALPIDLDAGSTERRQFYLLLAHKDLPAMRSYWALLSLSGKVSPPLSLPNARMAVDMVATNPYAIAYVDRSVVDGRVRIVLDVTP
jgi:hypothetical protein